MAISINPDVNASEFAEYLRRHGRVRIPNFLSEDSAELLRQTLSENTAWGLVHSDADGRPITNSAVDLEKMQAQEMQTIMRKLYELGGTQYQYIYLVYPIIDAIQQGIITDKSVLHEVATFFNGAAFLRFCRRLTGNNKLVKFDPQATAFARGHFLNLHDDMGDGREIPGSSIRRYAVVVSLTKHWSVNWGGQLNFFDQSGSSVCESWFPLFNNITIFEVPALHSVSQISPMAKSMRYSITGWLREDSSIERPDLD